MSRIEPKLTSQSSFGQRHPFDLNLCRGLRNWGHSDWRGAAISNRNLRGYQTLLPRALRGSSYCRRFTGSRARRLLELISLAKPQQHFAPLPFDHEFFNGSEELI